VRQNNPTGNLRMTGMRDSLHRPATSEGSWLWIPDSSLRDAPE
jgi:hypothetical protein